MLTINEKVVSKGTKQNGKQKKNKKKKKKAAKTVNRGIKKQFGKVSRNFLASINPYLNTILSPFQVQGVGIPDLIQFPSVKFSTVDRGVVNVTAGGTFGVFAIVGSPSACFQVNTAASTSNVLTWAAATGISAYTTVNGTYDRIRPVSAGLAVKYMGTPLSAQGRVVINFVPGNTGATLPGTSVSAVLARPWSQTKMAADAYFQTVYFPLDPLCYQYQAPSSTSWSCGYMVIVGDGMTAGASVEWTVVYNWEATPQFSTLSFLTPEVSRSDPIELAHATNIIGNTVPTIQPPKGVKPADNVAASGNLGMDVAGEHAEFQKNGGFLESVLNLITGGDPKGTMNGVLETAGKLAPIVSAFLV